ncbi:hypothetical protein HPB50_004907 [Hyalomma asiaticum]|uniref:Uncharacterized protein n=1 Tax=Hyalomma asiaticum TaxID=266040 RepID=A0ACB7RHC1_HYAAI|nr:hypothetical protein HPB50_004907 [Hyalomma asiaticum]
MAGRGALKSQPGSAACSYEGFDKLTSSTLKRHPKMELSKTELLKLLSVLEGELQAREIVIAVLKAEQVKQLLYPRKAGANGSAGSDPWAALQRDVLNAIERRFDMTSVRALHGLQLHHLEQLIALHRRVQARNREELRALEQRCAKLSRELDEERGKRAHDTAQGDNVTFVLEKEREHLRAEVDLEKQRNRRLEKELQQANDALEMERTRQKQMVLLLLAERKRLILRLIQERQRGDQLLQSLKDEKARSSEMVEGLEEESKRSLQMEEELERQAADFELERERFQTQVAELKAQNAQQQAELERLRQEAERLVPPPAPAPPPLGEGVRSATIITPASAPAPTVRAAVPTPNPSSGRSSRPQATPPTVPQVPPKPTPDRTLVKKPGPPTTPGTAGIASATGTVLRPTPPPVPPNKPVLQRKDLGPKPPVPPRTVPDAAQVGGGFTSSPARYSRCMMTSPNERPVAATASVPGLDLIGPELADFQSLLVSMAMEKPSSPLRGGS